MVKMVAMLPPWDDRDAHSWCRLAHGVLLHGSGRPLGHCNVPGEMIARRRCGRVTRGINLVILRMSHVFARLSGHAYYDLGRFQPALLGDALSCAGAR